jgi:hypothetical protein
MNKPKLESYDAMLARCAWEIMDGIVHGRQVLTVASRVADIVWFWQRDRLRAEGMKV